MFYRLKWADMTINAPKNFKLGLNHDNKLAEMTMNGPKNVQIDVIFDHLSTKMIINVQKWS